MAGLKKHGRVVDCMWLSPEKKEKIELPNLHRHVHFSPHLRHETDLSTRHITAESLFDYGLFIIGMYVLFIFHCIISP